MERMVVKRKVGITGQNGFIGRHLFNFLSLQDDVELIHFDRCYFEREVELKAFVSSCDTIVHLAAMNRHKDSNLIYETNVKLVTLLLNACKGANVQPHIIFSSSTQEVIDNPYGKSKKIGGDLIEEWANNEQGGFTRLVIPNVFGPFGKPYYNSVVATFFTQTVTNEPHKIDVDSEIKLIYINKLVSEIYTSIIENKQGKVLIKHQYTINVSSLSTVITKIYTEYSRSGIFPDLEQPLILDLFNTLLCYLPKDFYPRYFKENKDMRGSFVEVCRTNSKGQFSFSTTVPNITRGNHFHTRKAERFAVIKGQARVEIRKVDSDDVTYYILNGNKPSFVDIPVWHTHSVTNIGTDELLILFWINEPYNKLDTDTYFMEV